MDGSISRKEVVAKAATLKSCLVYLLQDAKEADLGWCALHLKIAISELNSITNKGSRGKLGKATVSLCGHSATNREMAN